VDITDLKFKGTMKGFVIEKKVAKYIFEIKGPNSINFTLKYRYSSINRMKNLVIEDLKFIKMLTYLNSQISQARK
jgi:hypothetical protein